MGENKKNLKKWLKRIACGLAAAGLYIISGNVYDYARIMSNASEVGKGHFNKSLDEKFDEEFSRDKTNLEFTLQEKNPKGNAIVPLVVYVHPGLKSYFDDANNPNDDNLWAKEVKNALSGLDIYRERGIEFKVRRVETAKTMGEFQTNAYACLYRPEYEIGEIAIAFYPMVNKFVPGVSLGQAYLEGNYAEIYLSNNRTYNQIITAHEMGHIFGISHEDEISDWACLYDPFRIFSTHLMRPYIESQDFSLTDEEEAIIEKAKERFQ
ncbi:MAG: hypothetical protein V1734_04510 [Nanoarchaeota archaeon]